MSFPQLDAEVTV